ncbi:hypothetical protein KAU32_11260 [bacterium]|nr:hypothetical protein [bacterium]
MEKKIRKGMRGERDEIGKENSHMEIYPGVRTWATGSMGYWFTGALLKKHK